MHFQRTFQNLPVASGSLSPGFQRYLSLPTCVTSGQPADLCAPSAEHTVGQAETQGIPLLGSRGGRVLNRNGGEIVPRVYSTHTGGSRMMTSWDGETEAERFPKGSSKSAPRPYVAFMLSPAKLTSIPFPALEQGP